MPKAKRSWSVKKPSRSTGAASARTRASSRVAAPPSPKTPTSSSAMPSNGAFETAHDVQLFLPLRGRVREFRKVLRFVETRLVHHTEAKSLFVYGACGCGKTSTVLRALRLCSDRAISLDSSGLSAHVEGKRIREASAAAAGQDTEEDVPRQRRRTEADAIQEEDHDVVESPLTDYSSSTRSSGSLSTSSCRSSGEGAAASGLAATACDADPHTVACWAEEFPDLMRRKPGARRVLAHYLNCADLTAGQLAESIVASIKATGPRSLDLASQELSHVLQNLPAVTGARARAKVAKQCDSGDEERMDLSDAQVTAAVSRLSKAAKGSVRGPLHVLAMDEVEYVRASGRAAISQLAAYVAHHPQHLALIFISNQRDLVHVPKSFLDDLGFEAYNVHQLKGIAQQVSEECLREALPEAAHRQLVQISPSLVEYICRKALSDFSGDARQVIAMSRRVIYAGVNHLQSAVEEGRGKDEAAGQQQGRGAGAATASNGSVVSLNALKSVVDVYTAAERERQRMEDSAPPSLRSSMEAGEDVPGRFSASSAGLSVSVASTRSSVEERTPRSSTSSSARHGAAVSGSALQPSSPVTTLTLASNIKLLRSCVVEEEAERYISTMTEQMAYVLSCLVVLRLRQQQEEDRRRCAIAGTMTSHASRSASMSGRAAAIATSKSVHNSISMRALHTLYSSLMSQRHFPSMNPAGISSAVDGLADIGIITRPQKRGNEWLFCFNGTWSLESMESALSQRGEVLRKEMEACGLDGAENRFASVMLELKRIAGVV